jgi:hypothetical protein
LSSASRSQAPGLRTSPSTATVHGWVLRPPA